MRESISKEMQLRVYIRDRWHCTYCAEPIFFSPTLKILDAMSPGRGYYDRHGRRGAMLSTLENRCACCDHVLPVAAGGPTDMENLVAACFECNRQKSDGQPPEKRERVGSTEPLAWDGFATLYVQLPGGDPAWRSAIGRAFGPADD